MARGFWYGLTGTGRDLRGELRTLEEKLRGESGRHDADVNPDPRVTLTSVLSRRDVEAHSLRGHSGGVATWPRIVNELISHSRFTEVWFFGDSDGRFLHAPGTCTSPAAVTAADGCATIVTGWQSPEDQTENAQAGRRRST